MPALTLNRDLLRSVRDRIQEKPKAFNMDTWYEVPGVGVPEIYPETPVCGSTACIAGWTVFLSGITQVEHTIPVSLSSKYRASGLLGLTDTQSSALFYDYRWPGKAGREARDLYRKYHEGTITAQERSEHTAELAVQLIDRIIKQGAKKVLGE